MAETTEMQKVIDQFDSYGYYLDDKLDRDIEENRKGQFALRFVDTDGKPLENVKVHIRQVSHEFKFGATMFYLDGYEDEERRAMWREKLAKICNYGVIPFYWDTLEPEEGKPRFAEDSPFVFRRPPIDTAIAYCKEHKMRMKGHCLVYNSFQPKWISDDNRMLRMQIDKRLRKIAEHCGEEFHEFDVINEMISIYKNCYPGNGCRNLQFADEPDYEAWSFARCREYFPYSKLYWNEGMYESFGDRYVGNRSFYYMTLKDHLTRGVPIDGIGMQYHCYCDKETAFWALKQVCNPLRLLDVFDRYGDFRLPVSVSEVSIPSWGNDEEGEAFQAEMVKRLYKLWFGRPFADSVVWWNFADRTAFGGENRFHAGLIRYDDCSEKPAYRVLDELINHTWHTEFSGEAGERLNFRGFYGDYEVEAVCGDKQAKKTIRLFRDTTGYDNRLCDFRAKDIVLA
ncbi:MAG: endo-1,4-beta-xylanase [Clostridia bacterium]|nr:endo-1,4-beta-xylanase [Clostridia bacterium]